MINELDVAIEDYQSKWQALVAARKDRAFFESLKATAVGWKTVDLDDFNRRFDELRDHAEHVHATWMNERWVAAFYLDESLSGGLRVVKLMQRRPGSTDAAGLDHIDFLLPQNADAKAILIAETDLKWTEEKNGDYCKWLSVWFDGTEAKLRKDTVLQVQVDEMLDYQKKVIGS